MSISGEGIEILEKKLTFSSFDLIFNFFNRLERFLIMSFKFENCTNLNLVESIDIRYLTTLINLSC